MTNKQKQISRELFKMVYQWGRVGLIVDHNSLTYKNMVGELLGNKSNGFCKTGKTTSECYIDNCKKKHLPF